MIRKVEKSGKTIDEAILAALQELNIEREDAQVDIVDEGSKGFLGIGSKDAVVSVTEINRYEKTAVDFLKTVTGHMGIDVTCDIQKEGNRLDITLEGTDMGIVIGRRGDTLDALQYLTSLVVNKNANEYVKIALDTENYRAKRQEALIILARKVAGQVIRTGRSSTLEPMNPNERRIIHAALQGNRSVYTYSVGDEPDRKIVVALKDRQKPAYGAKSETESAE